MNRENLNHSTQNMAQPAIKNRSIKEKLAFSWNRMRDHMKMFICGRFLNIFYFSTRTTWQEGSQFVREPSASCELLPLAL